MCFVVAVFEWTRSWQLLSTSRQFCNASLSFGFLSQFFICYLLSSWLKKHRLLLAVLPFFLSITEKTNNIRKKCERKQKDNEELQNSREVECSICRLWVHSKPTTTKHMFGLLSEWVLTFCYLALGNMTHSLKKNASAFLVCYKLFYFVSWSYISYATSEEKHDTLSFKAALK